MLTQDELKKYLHYDPSTGVFTRLATRSTKNLKNTIAGGVKQNGYVTVMVQGKYYQAHRLAWLYTYGVWPSKALDHIDGVKRNNKLDNLREATRNENGYNTGRSSKSISGVKGVHFCKLRSLWGAQACINGTKKGLGFYATKYEAYLAYDNFVKNTHGAFYKPQKFSMLQDIEFFHEKFGLQYTGLPRQLPRDIADFRIKFLNEELQELIKAVSENDLEGQLDALVDLVYVALGTAYLQGLPFQAAWDEVHGCNMRKVKAGPNGEGSKRGSPHDVIKPEGWVGPNYSKIL